MARFGSLVSQQRMEVHIKLSHPIIMGLSYVEWVEHKGGWLLSLKDGTLLPESQSEKNLTGYDVIQEIKVIWAQKR